MIITDKNRIDNLAEELFDNISYRHELSEDDYRVVSRHSKEIKAAFFQSSWFTEEELLALREEVATLMTDDLQDMLLLVKFPPESIMLDYEEEVLALLEKALEIWNCINLVHMVWKNMVGQTGVSIFIVCGYGKQSAYAIHRRWVKSVIRQLMTKLQVKGTMKQIVENYNYTPKSLKEHCPKLEMNPPEHARDVAWQIFMANMYETPHNVHSSDVCGHCGAESIELAYASPAWTRRVLCGRGGRMAFCPNCLRVLWSYPVWRN
ncbi:MAG: hypothetical protein J6K43_10625 [Lachnospiraceae bacterium]|nr:hypothetical protein [Lachnospiraceae bacterium]